MNESMCTTPGHEARHRPEHQWVCGGCVRGLTEDLASVAALYDELVVTLTRQDVIGGDGGRKSAETALPFKLTASEAFDVLSNTLSEAAGDLANHLGMQFPLNPARWLLASMDRLAGFDEAGRLVDEIRHAVANAYRAIDRPPELLLAGHCSESDGRSRCPGVLYARPGDVRVACPECGVEHEVAERRQAMVDAAAVLQVNKTTALSWVGLLMDREIPDGTWRSWRTRGRLRVHGLNASGQELFRFGDVRDLAIVWMARGKAA